MVYYSTVRVVFILILSIALLCGFLVSLSFADDFDVDLEDDDLDDDDHSLLGSVFHFVGDVFAFPFRLVGNLFDAIF